MLSFLWLILFFKSRCPNILCINIAYLIKNDYIDALNEKLSFETPTGFSVSYAQYLKKETPKKTLTITELRGIKLYFLNNFKQNNDMEKQDLNKIELPLSKEKFNKLRKSIESGQTRWRDMSADLTYAYQAFWRADKYQNCE